MPAAQDAARTTGLQTGRASNASRLQTLPRQVDAEARATAFQSQQGRAKFCNSFYSIQFDFRSGSGTLFDDLNVNFCIGRLMRGADNQVYHTYMQIQYSTLRNLLAEEAYLQDFDGPPARFRHAQDISGRFNGARVHPQVSTMACLADCLTYNAGSAAHDLLRARPGADDEEELSPHLVR